MYLFLCRKGFKNKIPSTWFRFLLISIVFKILIMLMTNKICTNEIYKGIIIKITVSESFGSYQIMRTLLEYGTCIY